MIEESGFDWIIGDYIGSDVINLWLNDRVLVNKFVILRFFKI